MSHIQQAQERAQKKFSLSAAGLLALALYILTIPLGNWVVMNAGLVCPGNGSPCLIPVLPGVWAPSGVMVAGAALVLRDAVHHYLGTKAAFIAILAGALLSGFLSPVSLIVASSVAFLFSETADLMVYAPLRKRYPSSAILASGLAGAVADSALFLFLAFGSLEFFWGQVIGKLWMSVIAAAVIALIRMKRESHAEAAAA